MSKSIDDSESGQMNLMELLSQDEVEKVAVKGIKVVKANFSEVLDMTWLDLFDGFDEMYGITFSSGIQFMEKVMDKFEKISMIFGCENVLSSDVAAIIATEIKSVEMLAKSKSAKRLAERLEDGSLMLAVSRDTRSHEKIFVLKAKDGRTRVITGSANMSASAFCGLQRENILCFDDLAAYDYYKNLFDDFLELCSDNVSQKVLLATSEDENHVRDNIDEAPFLQSVRDKNYVFLEQAEEDDAIIVADIKGLEAEIKPAIPKVKKENGKLVFSDENRKALKRKHKEQVDQKKIKEKRLPKLHLDYEHGALSFNGKEISLLADTGKIKSDILCLNSFMGSFSSFYGDWEQSQKDYFAFMNWYFASIFMPFLRFMGNKNNYDVTPFPVFGILYGESNGGKSTFVRFLSKMMCGAKIPLNNSNDFTSTNIDNLKRACEGLPINIDDLAKAQFDANYEKVIKDDMWGLQEGLINYPAVTISTNKVNSLKPDISKRAVSFFVGIRIDKETGAKTSKKINESMKNTTTSLFGAYISRMLPRVVDMVEKMKEENAEYFPDVFEASSRTLCELFEEFGDTMPSYASVLTYSDYFGDKAIGKNAMKKFITAWENDRKNFSIDKKKNTLTYNYSDSSRTYELKYMQQELPPVLNAQVVGSSLIMDLDKANSVFGTEFKKKFWE